MTLKDIYKVTIDKGGVTYSLWYGDMLWTPYYACPVHKDKEWIVPLERFNDAIIKNYVADNSQLLIQDEAAVGTWVHEGNVYLDIAILFHKDITTLDQILQVIKTCDQISAWDLEFNKEIKP